MTFALSPKITKKYGAYDSDELRQENISRRVPFGRVELDFYRSYGYHERNISGNYSLAIGFDYDSETYGPCIPDQEARGGCRYAHRKLNPELSYALYEKKGDSFKLVFKSDPFNPFKTEKDGTFDYNSADESVENLYVDDKRNAIAASSTAGDDTINLSKFNRKGKLKWIVRDLPDMPGGSGARVYHLTADNESNIYALYGHEDRGADALTLTKISHKNGRIIWSKRPLKELGFSGSSVRPWGRPLLVVDNESLLVTASGYFDDIDYQATAKVLQLDNKTGAIKDFAVIDNEGSDYSSELFLEKDTVYLRASSRAYSLGEVDSVVSSSLGDNLAQGEVGVNNIKLSAPNKFKAKKVDKIMNFNSIADILEVASDSFLVDITATFASGKNQKEVKSVLAKQDFDFLYDQKKGGLYFNENGADKGFGDGGIIAILKGAPDLNSDNLEFV